MTYFVLYNGHISICLLNSYIKKKYNSYYNSYIISGTKNVLSAVKYRFLYEFRCQGPELMISNHNFELKNFVSRPAEDP